MDMFRSQLKNRFRGKNEALPELGQAIQRLARQAYSEQETMIVSCSEASLSVLEVLEKDRDFVDAIADTNIGWKILQTRPGTIQEAIAVVTEVEAFQISQ